jgi:lipoic acid synthetase
MKQRHAPTENGAKPIWLKKRLPTGSIHETVDALISGTKIHTVCQKARCPNIWDCYSRKTATFMIMGDRCTRNCRFCAIAHGPLHPPDTEEPIRVAEAVRHLNLDYVVITSVTRDDLSDGGTFLFVQTINEIRKRVPNARIELLIPDLQGNKDALSRIVEACPDVLNHNIETVPRLYPTVRPEAVYRRSLDLLKQVVLFNSDIVIKSGLMLGLGENDEEIFNTLKDLLYSGCRLLTLGQYLRPTKAHLPVKRFVAPQEFDNWREIALEMGFNEAACGPFVRSSYHAKKLYRSVKSFSNRSN